VVNRDLVARKIARATAWMNDAEAIVSQPLRSLRRFFAAIATAAGL